MKSQSELEQQILDWIESKSFEELTGAEKELVLSKISREAYEAQRELMLRANASMADSLDHLSPDDAILSDLKVRISESKSKGISMWLTRRVPVYQPFSVAAVILLAIWMFGPSLLEQQSPKIQEKIVYQTRIDTLYMDRIVEVPQVVVQEVVRYETREISKPLELEISVVQGDQMAAAFYAPQEKPDLTAIQSSLGNTSIEEEELLQFRSGM